MANRDLIVVGASAGGIEALQEVMPGLPADLPAAVLVVLHMPPAGGQALRRILARFTGLPVETAEDDAPIRAGHVYVAVGGQHLLVADGRMLVRDGPRENGCRPAIDPLFRSAATYYRRRAIGVVLSGALSDGTAGLFSIRKEGGLAVVQDPEDAVYGSMPVNAIEYAGADHMVPAREIGPLLGRLAAQALPNLDPDGDPAPDPPTREVYLLEGREEPVQNHASEPSSWACPDCNGVLWEIRDGPILRFRCRVGHAWDAEALFEQQGDGVEAALWMALRALEDRAALSERLGRRAREEGRRLSALRYEQGLQTTGRSIEVLRRLLAGELPAQEVAGSGESQGG